MIFEGALLLAFDAVGWLLPDAISERLEERFERRDDPRNWTPPR